MTPNRTQDLIDQLLGTEITSICDYFSNTPLTELLEAELTVGRSTGPAPNRT